MEEKHIRKDPDIRLVFIGGDGLKAAFQMLARIIIEERKGEQKRKCEPPSTSE